jgi:hypothetical protein
MQTFDRQYTVHSKLVIVVLGEMFSVYIHNLTEKQR